MSAVLEPQAVPPARRRPAAMAIWVSLRPLQWAKNLLLFGGLVFTHEFSNVDMTLRALAAFGVYCLLASGVYLLNDLKDKQQDALHPEKRLRPIASGEIGATAACAAAVILVGVALASAYVLGQLFALIAVGYLALQFVYTTWFKNVVILDVFLLATGFVIRALAGAVVLGVTFSPWLFLCTLMLALFLAFGKRRNELLTLSDASSHRPALNAYTPALLDQAIGMSATATVLAYALYTIESKTGRSHELMMLSIPFVMYGVLRYLYHLYSNRDGGSPERILFSDIHIWLTLVLWIIVCILAMILSGGNRY